MVNTVITAVLVLAIGLGVLECFFGYRYLKPVMALLGFIGGFLLVTAPLYMFFKQSGTGVITGGLAVGIVAGLLMFFLYYVGIFFMGATVGMVIGYGVSSLIGLGGQTTAGIIAVLGIIAGILAILIRRHVVIVSSSLSGAYMLMSSIALLIADGEGFGKLAGYFASTAERPLYMNWVYPCSLLLGAVGIFVQYKYTAPKAEKAALKPTAESPATKV